MDIDKLIEQLKNLEACSYGYHINGEVLGVDCSDFEQVMADAAEEISKISVLQAENKKLRAELENYRKGHREEAISTLTPPNEWVNRVRELDELYTKLQIITGFTVEQLLEMFAAGYTLEKPDYSKSF